MKVWLDGRVVDEADAVVSVFDHAVTVGDGVFETLKIYPGGRPFAVHRHLERLEASASGLGLTGLPDPSDLRGAVGEVIAANGLDTGRMRITVTGGVAPLGSGRGSGPPTVVIAAGPLDPTPPATDAVVVPWPRNERSAVVGLKTTSYAENVVALAHAHAQGASEAVFANTAGALCEGTGTNVFYVVDAELRTPTLESGCLAGITRALLLEWYGAREVDEPVEVVRSASEVFLASTTRDVQAVSHWDDVPLPAPGPVTTEVREVWREREAELLEELL